MSEIYIMPVAAAKAKQDFEKTVLGSGPRYFWRLRLSKGNSRKWNQVNVHDYILFKGASRYLVSSRVIGKMWDGNLARHLWGEDESGERWDLIFELSRPTEISASVSDYEPLIGERFGGFDRVSHHRLQLAFAQFGREQFLGSFAIDRDFNCALDHPRS